MRPRSRTLIAVATLAGIILTAGCARQETDTGKTGTKTQAATATPDAKTVEHAAAFERRLREWGADSTIRADTLARKDAGSVLASLHGTPPADDPATGENLPARQADAGPHAANPACRAYRRLDQVGDTGERAWCADGLDAAAWLARIAWGYGSRWTDGPHSAADGTGVRVTGTVRFMYLAGNQNPNTLHVDDWWGITPTWIDYPVDDRLTVRDGRITGIRHRQADPWWIDPWLGVWDTDIGDRMNGRGRVGIPVKGEPDWGALTGDGLTVIPPETRFMADENVDMSLWGSIPVRVGDGQSCQNPGYC